jgi:hypothetical protein
MTSGCWLLAARCWLICAKAKQRPQQGVHVPAISKYASSKASEDKVDK